MPAASAQAAPPRVDAARIWYRASCAALLALVLFMLARELYLAPLRPGGSLLALKALPLALALPGVFRRRLYTYQWAALLVLVYLAFAVVSGLTDAAATARLAGWGEALLCAAFFGAALMYVRPYKRAHKAARRATAHPPARAQ